MLTISPGLRSGGRGEGLSVTQVADKVVEAERRERETRQQLDSPAITVARTPVTRRTSPSIGWRGIPNGAASPP
ncbi:hypothetical protein QF035_000100 [Streptomyces umbrinus]|uniref:Uncharacterized protein n=1 Tax=Streptomyces umbrinus TaxID=67370 RepID=A0ABU0SG33_9ACTN|nr:hypothetical protein [Streptomyces umbrinus]MDQ1022518.1 hypothetical protein [Streptomyces umbrinus]